MKRFFKLLFIFTIPILFIGILDSVILSPVFFANRVWEGLSFNDVMSMPFYPNQSIKMAEIGDLGFHTKAAVVKNVVWKTDRLGFRNDSVVLDPDILIVGDSFVAGSTLTQDSTLTNTLIRLTNHNYKIYNIAPVPFNTCVSLLNKGIIKKPKLIICVSVERFMGMITDTLEDLKFNNSYILNQKYPRLYTTIDRFRKFTSMQWFNARFKNRKGIGFPSKVNPKMLFFEGTHSIDNDSILYHESIKSITLCNEKCKKWGVKFIYIPMPNKETVYWDLVPYSKQPNLLFLVASALNKLGIENINPLPVYNREKKKGRWLYNLDDTHWASPAVNVLAKEIVHYIDSTKILNSSYK